MADVCTMVLRWPNKKSLTELAKILSKAICNDVKFRRKDSSDISYYKYPRIGNTRQNRRTGTNFNSNELAIE